MRVEVEADNVDAQAVEQSVQTVLKLRGSVQVVASGSLPNDGKVIDDQRKYD